MSKAPVQKEPSIVEVLIAEDNQDFSRLLKIAIDSQTDMRVTCSLPRADSILKEIERLQPHVLIIDLSMPGKQPLLVIREAADQFPAIRTIAFSAHDDQETIDRVLRAGAAGYISKMQGLQSIITGVRQAASGEAIRDAG